MFGNLGIPSSCPNGSYTLPYETLGDEDPKKCHPSLILNLINLTSIHGYSNLMMELSTNRMSDCLEGDILSAFELAYEGYGERDVKNKIEIAEKALKISDGKCNVAYNILALWKAKNYRESIKYFEKSIEVSSLMCPEIYNEHLKTRDIHQYVYLRPMERAYIGLARCHRGLKRYHEALECLLRLEYLQKVHKNYSTYFNFRYLVPEMLIRNGRYEECRKYFEKHQERFLYTSVSLCWSWDCVLLEYILFKKKGGKDKEFFDESRIKTGVPNGYTAIDNVSKVAYLFPHVASYLKGEFKLPNKIIPTHFSSGVNMANNTCQHLCSAIYVRNCGDMWKEYSHLVDHICKVANTFQIANALMDPRRGINNLPSQKYLEYFTRKVPDLKVGKQSTIEYFMKRGYYVCVEMVDNLIQPKENYWDSSFDINKIGILNVMKRDGKYLNLQFPNKLSILHKYCYHQNRLDCVEFLVTGPKDIIHDYPQGGTPVQMACYRGNWRILKYFMEKLKFGNQSKKKEFVKDLLGNTLSNGCMACVSGSTKCYDCVNGEDVAIPRHASDCDFKKCIDILIQHGVTESMIRNFDFRQGMPVELYRYAINHAQNKDKPVTKMSVKKLKTSKKKGVDSSKGISNSPYFGMFDRKEGAKIKKCEKCGKTKREVGKLKKCSGCKMVLYCSRECQLGHWKEHKKECKKNRVK